MRFATRRALAAVTAALAGATTAAFAQQTQKVEKIEVTGSNIKRSEGETRIKLNESALRQVLAALDGLKAKLETAPPRPEALLGIKGVLEVVEPEESEADMQARTAAMLAGLAEAGLVVAERRGRETRYALTPAPLAEAAIARAAAGR